MIWINPASSRYASKTPVLARFAAEDLASQIAEEAWKHLVAGTFRRRLLIFVFLRPSIHRLAVLLLEMLAMLLVLRARLAMRRAVIAVPALLLSALAIGIAAVSVTPVIAVPVPVVAAATVTVAVTLLLTATLPAMFLALVALRLVRFRRSL